MLFALKDTKYFIINDAGLVLVLFEKAKWYKM